MGTLYIVATPIGNLEDVTLRAIRILSEVDIIAAEDTRVTKKLLTFLNDQLSIVNYRSSEKSKKIKADPYVLGQLGPKIVSYHQHSNDVKKLEILNYLVQGKDVALVTDAGTPGIQDPGNELISFILERDPGINVVPVPGPSALSAAISICGFNANKFTFLGFLGKKGNNKLFNELKEKGSGVFAFFESPFRVIRSLSLIKEIFGNDLKVFVGREMTKMHETIYRGSPDKVIEDLSNDKLKGELIVIVWF